MSLTASELGASSTQRTLCPGSRWTITSGFMLCLFMIGGISSPILSPCSLIFATDEGQLFGGWFDTTTYFGNSVPRVPKTPFNCLSFLTETDYKENGFREGSSRARPAQSSRVEKILRGVRRTRAESLEGRSPVGHLEHPRKRCKDIAGRFRARRN